MKKALLLGCFFCFAVMGYSQSQRLAFVEEFTQASCPPCETTTPALNQIIEENKEKIVQIRYQTAWPGVDPMNADNPTEVQSRVEYYGVTGVPNVRVDGVSTDSPGVLPQATIDASYNNPAPVKIEVEHTINDLETMSVTVRVINESDVAFEDVDDKLRVALVEEVISWNDTPGSTSLVDFEAVMKKFFTGTEGVDMPEIAAGEMWENTWEGLEIPDYVYNYNELAVVAWLQNDATKAVHNSGYSAPQKLEAYADLAIESFAFEAADGNCDYAYSTNVTVENRGLGEAGAYTVNLLFNGEVSQTLDVTEALAGESSNTITFEAGELAAGTTVVSYEVVLDGEDVGSLNNESKTVTAGKVGPASDLVEEGFENETVAEFASSSIVDLPSFPIGLNGKVINSEVTNANNAMGAYAESENSIMVNFYQWNPANTNPNGEIIIAKQYTVPAVASVSFDYAFTTWGGSNDKLQVQVSTDCGESYKDIFSQSGAALATAPELMKDNEYFKPKADQWRTIQADLTDYEGQDVLIRFYFTSSWGDAMYIDNVELKNVASNENELTATEKLTVYPNPATTDLSFDLDIENAAEVTVTMMDLLGRTVMTQSLGTIDKVNHTINTSDFESGAYLLRINAGERVFVRKVSIVK